MWASSCDRSSLDVNDGCKSGVRLCWSQVGLTAAIKCMADLEVRLTTTAEIAAPFAARTRASVAVQTSVFRRDYGGLRSIDGDGMCLR